MRYRFPEDLTQPSCNQERTATHVETAFMGDDSMFDLEIAWLTSCATRGWVEIENGGPAPSRVEEDELCLRKSWARPDLTGCGVNHRAFISKLSPGSRHTFRIVTQDMSGIQSRTDPHSVVVPVSQKNQVCKIPITIWSPSAKIRKKVPVSQGVPLPENTIWDEGDIRLFDESGESFPVQAQPVAWCRDGSIKWLWLDFQVDLTGEDRFELVFGDTRTDSAFPQAVSPGCLACGPFVSLKHLDGGLVVDTGAASMVLPTSGWKPGSRSRPPGFYRRDGVKAALSFPTSLTKDTKGNVYRGDIDSIEIESAGPLHTVIKLSGVHRREGEPAECLKFQMRIHAYAGKSFFMMDHTLGFAVTAENSIQPDAGVAEAQVGYGAGRRFSEHPDPRITRRKMLMRIRKAGLVFSTGEDKEGVSGGGLEIPEEHIDPGERLVQTDESVYYKQTDVGFDARRCALSGSFVLNGTQIAVKDFTENYPKSIEAFENGAEIGLFPEIAQEWYDGQPFENETKLFYHIREGFYLLHRGVEKTHRMMIDVDANGEGMLFLEAPPVAAAAREWIESSGCFLPLATELKLTAYDNLFDLAVKDLLETRRNNREYGALNYGDWHGERGANWGNLEYDLHHGLIRQFLRTGNPEFARQAALAAWHQGDVDVCHDSPWPEQIGGIHEHKVGHTGGYYAINTEAARGSSGQFDNKIVLAGTMDPGHLWEEGMLELGLLLQDRRSLENGRFVADWMATAWPLGYKIDKYDRGWPLVGAAAAYRLIDDPFYLNALRVFAEKLVDVSEETGLVQLPLSHRHCGCGGEEHRGCAIFIAGIHTTGKILGYLATGDEELEENALQGYVKLVNEAWHPEFCGFRNTTCPYTGVYLGGQCGQIIDSLAYAAWRTGKPRHASICRNVLAFGWEHMSGQGKAIAVHTYKMPQALSWLSRVDGPSLESYRREIVRRWNVFLEQRWPTPVPAPDFQNSGWESGPDMVLRDRELTGRYRNSASHIGSLISTAEDSLVWVVPGEEHRLSVRMEVRQWPGDKPPTFVVTADSTTLAETKLEGDLFECRFIAPGDFCSWRIRLLPPRCEGPVSLRLISCDLYTTAQIAVRTIYFRAEYNGEQAHKAGNTLTWQVILPNDGNYQLWIERSGPEERMRLDIPAWPKRNHDYKWNFLRFEPGSGNPTDRRWHAFNQRLALPKGAHELTLVLERGTSVVHRLFITDAC